MATQKKKVLVGITATQADEAFASFAKADSRSVKIMAEIELKCTAIRKKFDVELTTLKTEKDKAFEVLQTFAQENPDKFLERKSLELTHGVIGYRTGTHKLDKLKGFTWEMVKANVAKYLPDFIRVKEELNKEQLIAKREEKDVVKLADKCGYAFVQDESFYVQPKEA